MRIGDQRHQYLEKEFGLVDPVLSAIEEKMHSDNCSGMSLTTSELRFVSFLIKNFHLKKILEIGTLYGHSAKAMSLAVDTIDGHILTIEKNANNFSIASGFLKTTKSITCKLGDAVLEMQKLVLEKEKFDLILIDADKISYPVYLENALLLLNPGGFIIGDNTFLFDEILDSQNVKERTQAMRKFNSMIAENPQLDSFMLNTPEGMTLARLTSIVSTKISMPSL